ncbi:MAG: GNAT family N-acetyltransferase [Alphaproteobacteria bacterium]|nr:GNAT family N-acetyltransferase [Alphaproteobacteria bacterium]
MTTILRAATVSDAAAIQAIYAPIVETTAISFEEDVPSVEEMARRIETYSQTHPYLVAERDGEILGYAYGSKHRDRSAYRLSVDVTAYVAASARGQGLGKRLYQALLPDLATRGYHAAFAAITQPNAASVALHESVGFTKVGIYREVGFKFGRWHDVGWWQRVL